MSGMTFGRLFLFLLQLLVLSPTESGSLSTLVVNALGAKEADSVASIYRVIQTFDDTDGSDSNKTLPDLSFLSERILYTLVRRKSLID